MSTLALPLATPTHGARPQPEGGAGDQQTVALALFEQSADLVWAVDRSYRLLAANPAFRAFLQRVRGADVPAGATLWSEGHQSLFGCYERAIRGEHVALEIVWGKHTIELTAVPMSEGGRIIGAVLQGRDVTAARAELAELRRRVEAQERQQKELKLYTQHVAHDLKNPLTGIATSAQVLRKRMQLGLSANTDQLVECIGEMAMRSATMVDELLRIAEQGHLAAQAQPLDLKAIVDDICRRFAPQIAERGAELLVAEPWPEAAGHPSLVTSIWENYLSNALKYGGARPRIELGARREADGRVLCWVRDEGPGLSHTEQALLFAPFVRLQREGPGGHGLGLALVRHNAERMGGSAGVESAPGRGACFYFTLPAAVEEPALERAVGEQARA